ncbi:hypothetical protein BPT24_075 [Tenacibaculum phage pT24]|uniref:Uncharacterized protein n=1 Tax=Tenacibaculum phage pT24 TaxID=1880590 RepID=A0A1B4XWK5_9CAUD|nr:hypothetical protein HYP10_gp075 [Tenacibaculum phage pT24]BAV39198.1 hypothetical protein BPT24_075 [Tenacibaculum phage pT24]
MRYIILPIIKALFFLKSMFVLLSISILWVITFTILTLWYLNPKKAYKLIINDGEFPQNSNFVFKEFLISGYARGLEDGYNYYWKTWYDYIFWKQPVFRIDTSLVDRYSYTTFYDPINNLLLSICSRKHDLNHIDGSIYFLRVYRKGDDAEMIKSFDLIEDNDYDMEYYLKKYCKVMNVNYLQLQHLKKY